MNAYELAKDYADLLAFETKELSMWFRNSAASLIIQQANRVKEMEQECSVMREQLKHLEAQVYGGTTK